MWSFCRKVTFGQCSIRFYECVHRDIRLKWRLLIPILATKFEKKIRKKCPKVTFWLEKTFLSILTITSGSKDTVWPQSWALNSKKIFLKKCPKVTFRLEIFFFAYAYDIKRTILHGPWKFRSIGRMGSNAPSERE